MNKEEEITLQERVSEMYKHAISSGFASSKGEFAEKVGVTNVTLSRFLNGKQEPSLKTLQAINVAMGHPFSDEWLFYGTGSMTDTDDNMPRGDRTIEMLIEELRAQREAKDSQIDRLLGIIEQMQKN